MHRALWPLPPSVSPLSLPFLASGAQGGTGPALLPSRSLRPPCLWPEAPSALWALVLCDVQPNSLYPPVKQTPSFVFAPCCSEPMSISARDLSLQRSDGDYVYHHTLSFRGQGLSHCLSPWGLAHRDCSVSIYTVGGDCACPPNGWDCADSHVAMLRQKDTHRMGCGLVAGEHTSLTWLHEPLLWAPGVWAPEGGPQAWPKMETPKMCLVPSWCSSVAEH